MATLTKRKGARGISWRLTWSQHGQQYRKSLGRISSTEARIILQEKELELLTGKPGRLHGVTLNEFASEYLHWYRSQYPASYDRTESILRCHLLPAFGLADLDRITPQDVERWKAARQAKAATIDKELRVFKALLNRAVRWGVIYVNPITHVEGPQILDSKAPRFYSAPELQSLYAGSPHHRDQWRLMANTGLRRGEALHLRREHIRSGEIAIQSEPGARTKSRRWRTVPLSPAAGESLAALLELDTGPLVLPSVTPQAMTRAFATCANRAALDGSLHTLRHTFCSHLVMAGVPLRTVQQLAGHASIKTTEKYAHLSDSHLRESVQSLNL